MKYDSVTVMRYILNEEYSLCGWKNMPFAIMNKRINKSIRLPERTFELLFKCSGRREIDQTALSEDDRKIFEDLVNDGVIREASDGEKRTLAYTEYKGIYKDSVHWSITGKCNYKCRHCFQSAPQGILGEPTTDQCFDIIRQLNECGIRNIDITGGEPLIRDDFFSIIDEILRYGMRVTTIYSNGKLITDEFLDELEKRGMSPSFNISFDGAGWHDWMRGVEGAEEAALDTFRRLKSRGFIAGSSMCLCRENIGSIRESVLKLAEAGCSAVKFQRSMPMGEWADQQEHYLTYDETLQAYMDYLPQYKEDGMPIDIQMEGFFMYSKGSGYSIVADRHGREDLLSVMSPCGVIQGTVYIGPNGAVTPCMSMNGAAVESQFPNIFRMPLEDILTDSSYTKLTGYRVKDVLDHTEKCLTCGYRLKCCSGCRALALGQDGTDYLGVDEITCKILTEGWADRLDEIAGQLFEPAGLPENAGTSEREKC